MTRIIALSDTHLMNGDHLPVAVVTLAREADIILHAGDFVSLQAYSDLKSLGRLVAVRGNSDSPQLKSLLMMKLLQGAVDEVLDMFLLCSGIYPAQPGPQMHPRFVHSAEKRMSVFRLK